MSELYNRSESFKVEQVKAETFMATVENIKPSEEMTIERADDIFSSLLSDVDDEEVITDEEMEIVIESAQEFFANNDIHLPYMLEGKGYESPLFVDFYTEHAHEYPGKSAAEVYEGLSEKYSSFDSWLCRPFDEKHFSLEEYEEKNRLEDSAMSDIVQPYKDIIAEIDAASGSDSVVFKSFYDANIDQFDGKSREQVYEEFLDQYEFFDKWLNRDDEESHISLEDFNEIECQKVYGDVSTFDYDDDSNDSY